MSTDCGCRDDSARADHKFQMADGSYPIDACTGENSVESAAKLAHHSKTYSFEQVKAHVMKAKSALGCPNSVLPSTWTAGENSARPPRDELVRGVWPFELRAGSQDGMPTLTGHFAVWNQWTEIDSIFEGRFMESIAPGAFSKTIQENRSNLRVLFNHGKDSRIGQLPLGPIDVLEEDDQGARYEVPLLDTSYNRDLLPGLQAGLYGASFRFSVVKEDFERRPKPSDGNPEGIPERTVREVALREFGPVTFPAYQGATAGIRSLTDDFIVRQLVGEPERLLELLHHFQPAHATALPRNGAEATHSEEGSRDDSPRRLAVIRNPNRRT